MFRDPTRVQYNRVNRKFDRVYELMNKQRPLIVERIPMRNIDKANLNSIELILDTIANLFERQKSW